MNIYDVSGRVVRKIRYSGEKGRYGIAVEKKQIWIQVEAETEADAADTALKQQGQNSASSNLIWDPDYDAPEVKLVREIPEDEMMRRIGAPRLFD